MGRLYYHPAGGNWSASNWGIAPEGPFNRGPPYSGAPDGYTVGECNGATVVVDVDIACDLLENQNGGHFEVASERTIVAEVDGYSEACVMVVAGGELTFIGVARAYDYGCGVCTNGGSIVSFVGDALGEEGTGLAVYIMEGFIAEFVGAAVGAAETGNGLYNYGTVVLWLCTGPSPYNANFYSGEGTGILELRLMNTSAYYTWSPGPGTGTCPALVSVDPEIVPVEADVKQGVEYDGGLKTGALEARTAAMLVV